MKWNKLVVVAILAMATTASFAKTNGDCAIQATNAQEKPLTGAARDKFMAKCERTASQKSQKAKAQPRKKKDEDDWFSTHVGAPSK